MGKVIAICTSKHKGTLKNEVSEANFIEEFGIEGDAHAGKWHRQVSLLALEKIEDFRNKGGNVDFGAFGENLVIEGFELNKLPVGQRLTIGEEVLLEVTQIGKECHDKCAIYYQVGECIEVCTFTCFFCIPRVCFNKKIVQKKSTILFCKNIGNLGQSEKNIRQNRKESEKQRICRDRKNA